MYRETHSQLARPYLTSCQLIEGPLDLMINVLNMVTVHAQDDHDHVTLSLFPEPGFDLLLRNRRGRIGYTYLQKD